MSANVIKLWEKAINQSKENYSMENYAYTVGIVKKIIGIKEEFLREDVDFQYAIPTFVIPNLFESFMEEDEFAYYLTIPSYLIESESEEENEDCLPILGFKEVYNSNQDLIKFNLIEGKIKGDEVKVAVIKEARLDQFSNQISHIIRRTSEDRLRHGTEWARAKLVDVGFNADPDQLTFRWRTEPTEHEKTVVEIGKIKGKKVTSTRNVPRGAVDTVPDISRSTYVKSPTGGNKVNFSKDTAYIMEIQFTAKPSWKKSPYTQITKRQISDMIKTAKVRFFCSCPHFNWGAIAYNLTLEDASIQIQKNPGKGVWNSRHGKPHKLCKHLKNLLKGFVIWENSMTGMVRKKALAKQIEY
jgi:hypothetical protein